MSDHVGSNLLLQFSEDIMVPITDSDEEIFLLYTRLASLKPAEGHLSSPFRGLGFLDASKDLLPVRLDILPRAGYKPPACDNTPTVKGRKAARKRVNRRQEDHSITLELELWQDRTALRSRAGDTGSVLWRASIDFATFMLQLARFPYPGALFDSARLAGAHAFELGAGTGLLAATLSPLFRRYTATDMPELVPLLRKNAPSGSHTCALDWTLPAAHQVPDDILSDPADLLLAVDCIYHPSLISPLLNTISSLCLPGRTLVLVMSELRAEDVMRQFLQEWFARAEERWRIWRVEDDSSEATDAFGARYAMWIAWRGAV